MSYAFDGNNRISGGVTYDPAGNMTFDGANYYTYDAENRLIGVGTGPGSSNIASYGYDAEGRRDSKTSSGLTLDYLYDLAGHQLAELTSSGTVNRQEIYAGGSHLGTYAGTTTYFHHADWLGTERARSNMTAQACETVASLPFGDGQTNSGNCGDPSPMHFTGKERDSESGLHYFGARYYGSSLGRFMSFDPVQMSRKKLLDPQQWNMYSYTRNNPLRFVDPDGREVKVLDPEALKRIKSTLPKDLQNQVTADKNGVLDKKAIDKIKSDDPNVKALKQAVDLKGTIEVKTDSKAQGFNFEYKSVEQVRQEVQKAGGDPSQITFPELYLGYTQKPSESPSGDFRVIVSDATGEAANAPESELAVTTAHELYGHALPGAEGKAWEHDNGGPVDHQIKNIEDHTRSLYPDK